MQRILIELLIGKDNWNATENISISVFENYSSFTPKIHLKNLTTWYCFRRCYYCRPTISSIFVRFRTLFKMTQLAFWFRLPNKHLPSWKNSDVIISFVYFRCIISDPKISANTLGSEKYGFVRCLPWDTSKAMGHLVPFHIDRQFEERYSRSE